ncbi:Glycogen accumulation regulator GarA [Maioricimonas rarisocia]|uniref:Glycogen accumulation regulator GarA n=1 Tax=Maioricimonas rarisocia TaxID=2528026 RepID=A0A517Z5L2_9PLAN|nr:FHA domain-containing protein [Maioricimonas rarisocia]QDU37753.1 Glycogen accumulation regulator GarA [Maioricimonas rarisocia]
MPLFLIPDDGSKPVVLDKAIVFFGRHADCDVVLANSRKVSRKHCCVARVDDHYVVRDLGSMNGVRVNGDAVEGEAQLRDGDDLLIGDVAYRLQVEDTVALRDRQRPLNAGGPSVSPDMLSQDMPVAIPEEGEDFRVEKTIGPSLLSPDGVDSDPSEEEIIELKDDDLVD